MRLVIVKLKARNTEAVRVQEVLTKHGCAIALRVGMHEHVGDACTNEGVIILKVHDDPKSVKAMVKDLKAVGKLVVKEVEV
jgi:hypothetical protein